MADNHININLQQVVSNVNHPPEAVPETGGKPSPKKTRYTKRLIILLAAIITASATIVAAFILKPGSTEAAAVESAAFCIQTKKNAADYSLQLKNKLATASDDTEWQLGIAAAKCNEIMNYGCDSITAKQQYVLTTLETARKLLAK